MAPKGGCQQSDQPYFTASFHQSVTEGCNSNIFFDTKGGEGVMPRIELQGVTIKIEEEELTEGDDSGVIDEEIEESCPA